VTENLHCSAKNKHVAANAYNLHFESGREQSEVGVSRTELSIYGGFAIASAVTGLDGSGIHRTCIAMGLTQLAGDLEELATAIVDTEKLFLGCAEELGKDFELRVLKPVRPRSNNIAKSACSTTRLLVG
jgi:hypothetical protein